MNPDFRDFLAALLEARVRFLVVGAHALAVHGVTRATEDLDVWVEPSAENAARVWRAFGAFGAPAQALGITPDDLTDDDVVVQFGLPPHRIDVMTGVSGLSSFAEAWEARVVRSVGALEIPFIGRDALIRNKRASGRHKDLGDVEALGARPEPDAERDDRPQ